MTEKKISEAEAERRKQFHEGSRRLLFLGLQFGCLIACSLDHANAKDGLYICAEHADPDDWKEEFAAGPIVVPAGAVFEYAGHLLSDNLQDPQDSVHYSDGRWSGISKEEGERRAQLLSEDMSLQAKRGAVATLQGVTLTKSTPCAFVQAEVVVSKVWGWSISPVQEEASTYFQMYGVIRRGALDTNFDDDRIPLNAAAARGELNASVKGTITKALDLDQWTASLPPDNNPAEGKGNSECLNDPERQDVSCRALTDEFLLSMRGATKAEVVKAMNVSGRQVEIGLHFMSNYSQGQRWGSGDVNFTFDESGHVSIISALIDPPNSNGKPAEFIWNSKLLPAGCSDLPQSKLPRCN